PWPAPSWSRMTTSSPSGFPSFSAFKLYGTPMIQRKLIRLGWQRDSVTVPITLAMRMAVKPFVLNSHHEPAHGRILRSNHLSRAGAVVANDHMLIRAGAQVVNRQERLTIGRAVHG